MVPTAAKVWAAWSFCLQPYLSQANASSPKGAFIDQSEKHDGVCIGKIKCPPACVQLIPTANRLQATLFRAFERMLALRGDLGKEGVQGSLAKDKQLACYNSPGNFSALCLVAAELVTRLGPQC